MSAPKKAEIGADRGFETRVGAEIGQNQHRDFPGQQVKLPILCGHRRNIRFPAAREGAPARYDYKRILLYL